MSGSGSIDEMSVIWEPNSPTPRLQSSVPDHLAPELLERVAEPLRVEDRVAPEVGRREHDGRAATLAVGELGDGGSGEVVPVVDEVAVVRCGDRERRLRGLDRQHGDSVGLRQLGDRDAGVVGGRREDHDGAGVEQLLTDGRRQRRVALHVPHQQLDRPAEDPAGVVDVLGFALGAGGRVVGRERPGRGGGIADGDRVAGRRRRRTVRPGRVDGGAEVGFACAPAGEPNAIGMTSATPMPIQRRGCRGVISSLLLCLGSTPETGVLV